MPKWFPALIVLLLLLLLYFGYTSSGHKPASFNVSQIKPRGLVDTKLIKHSIDILPLLKYPPTKDGDAGQEYLQAMQMYDSKRVIIGQNGNQTLLNTEAPELDFLLKAAQYKSCDVYSFISTSFAINKPPFLAFQIMTKALREKGNNYILNNQPDKALHCYEAGLIMGYWMTKGSDQYFISKSIGLAYEQISLVALIRYYQNKGDFKKADLWDAYRKENDAMRQIFNKKTGILYPLDINYKTNPTLYKYTGLNKPFTIDTAKFDAMIEIALFDESTVWRADAVYNLGMYRFLTQEDALGITINTNQRMYIEGILKYIQSHDKDSTVRETAKKALAYTTKDAKNHIIDSIISYQAMKQWFSASTSSAPTPTPTPSPNPSPAPTTYP